MRETNKERKWIHGRGHVNRNFQLTENLSTLICAKKEIRQIQCYSRPDADNNSRSLELKKC